MAKVKGMKEKLHMPLYDAFFVDSNAPSPRNTFGGAMTDPRVIRFFVDVQNKTKLETNLQAAGVLPSLNTFEARAMRVVASVPPLLTMDRNVILTAGDTYCREKPADGSEAPEDVQNRFITAIQNECERACQAAVANSILPELIYNSVTTLLVGEKVMIEMPTFYFPAGAGVSPGNGGSPNHGEPDPMATFRFAEPVFIEPQQNFRVEMVFPRDIPSRVRSALGPLRLWVVLDGYLTRDVQ